jgi:tRNA(Ile)-lysidine synthase
VDTSEFVEHFNRTFPDLVGGSVLVALSGGCDSVTLLHLLGEPPLNLELFAAHVHHGLRGIEADADATFCTGLCGALGVRCAVLRLPDDDEKPATGEAAWRRRRYRALLEHASSIGVRTVATAHHRDDVAEGVLLQLLRGAGPRAMAGIGERTLAGVIRPLLPWGRDEISSWAVQRGCTWREDGSNTDSSRLRNRVRHLILPHLEEETPRLRDHLVNLAGALAESESYLASQVVERARFIDPWLPAGGVELASLQSLPQALRARWLQAQTVRLGLAAASRRQLALFHSLLDRGAPRAVTIGGRWRLRAARGRLWAEPPVDPPGRCATIEPGHETDLGIPGWRARTAAGDARGGLTTWSWRPQAERSVISVRPAADDDRLPCDGTTAVRARNLIAAKLPRHLRRGWPLFCEDGMIHWIPGVWQHPTTGGPSSRVVEVFRR